MSIYAVSIRKHISDNSDFAWSNVWHVQAADLAGAHTIAQAILLMESQVHTSDVTFYEVHTQHVRVVDDFITQPVDFPGTFTSTGDSLPRFLAVRFDLTPTEGRSGRKFFHTMLHEGDISNGQVDDIAYSTFQDALDGFFTIHNDVCVNETGTHTYVTGVVKRNLTQHQFKRKWARRGGP